MCCRVNFTPSLLLECGVCTLSGKLLTTFQHWLFLWVWLKCFGRVNITYTSIYNHNHKYIYITHNHNVIDFDTTLVLFPCVLCNTWKAECSVLMYCIQYPTHFSISNKVNHKGSWRVWFCHGCLLRFHEEPSSGYRAKLGQDFHWPRASLTLFMKLYEFYRILKGVGWGLWLVEMI